MAILFGGKISYTEFVSRGPTGASPVEHLRPNGQTRAERIFDEPWDSRQALALQILGDVGVKTEGGTAYISRSAVEAIGGESPDTPHGYPGYQGYNYWTGGQDSGPIMWARAIDPIIGYAPPWATFGGNMLGQGSATQQGVVDNSLARYKMARMTVHYESLPWAIFSDQAMKLNGWITEGLPDEASLTRNVIVEDSPSGEVVTLPYGAMYLVPEFYLPPPIDKQNQAGVPISSLNLRPPKIIPKHSLRIKHIEVPIQAVPTQYVNPFLTGPGAIDTNLGCVNSVAFPPTGPFAERFAPGTLLYVAAIVQRTTLWNNKPVCNITHCFQVIGGGCPGQNYVPWMMTKTTFGWVQVTTDGTDNTGTQTPGKSIYDWQDHSELFRPPQPSDE